MNTELGSFAARLRSLISQWPSPIGQSQFSELALELFALQFKNNPAYQKICLSRGLSPERIEQWTQIPPVPTSAFKELDLSCIPPGESTAVFHSSGTTEQKPSRHFHHAESLAVYETSLGQWFERNLGTSGQWMILTPRRSVAPNSSLIYMFETVRRNLDAPASVFMGELAVDGSWDLDYRTILRQLHTVEGTTRPVNLLGTAFSFVHLLDYLAANDLYFQLPSGSRVMETGGYKNRSRALPKEQLHKLISDRLGVPAGQVICEYGMSELSSQAYSANAVRPSSHHFQFPPWARAQIISPENGREVPEGGSGIIRVLDLANVYSVAAIQTEDLGIRCGDGFELIGRAEKAEPRGCSLMAAS